MKHTLRTSKRISLIFLFTGLALLLAGAVYAVQTAYAQPQAEVFSQASPLHPAFPLLDASGQNVVESGAPLSTMKTCGQCHDTAYIASHSYHSDLGMSEQVAAGALPGSQPWETSAGLFGQWNPLMYRYLSPAGDVLNDLERAEWVRFNAARIVGGGPAEASGVEMNCFLCHIQPSNNPERVAAIQADQGEWAATATLLDSGLVNGSATEGYTWASSGFTADGLPVDGALPIQDPTNTNCAQCHGVVHTDNEIPLSLTDCTLENWQTATTGQVIAAGKISSSGINLAGKETLTRSWDVHAERGLTCTDCHYSLNNPTYYQSDESPDHLAFDPRRLEIGEYLEKPDHNFARGQSAQTNIAAELKGSMRRCESCHDATANHADWLPYTERHMAEIACETCHIPQTYAPAVQACLARQ